MRVKNSSALGRSFVLFLAVTGLVAAIIMIPGRFASTAAAGSSLFPRTTSHEPGLANYDIRTDEQAKARDFLAVARADARIDAGRVADIRDGFVRGEDALRARVPGLKVEYNQDLRIPEVISPDVWADKLEYLMERSGGSRSSVLRGFIQQNNELINLTVEQVAGLKVTADYTNPDGKLSYTHLEQFINDIPVFRGEIKAGFAVNGQMFRVVNNLAPGLDYARISNNFGDPAIALRHAAGQVDFKLEAIDVDASRSTDRITYFGTGDFAPAAEKMYFSTEPGVARAAWRVFIDKGPATYYVMVDAETGTMLWRKNLTEDQTQSATYNIYGNPSSLLDAAENPNPFTPGPTTLSGAQGAQIARVNRTLIGNEGPLSFNNLGWMTDNTGPGGCPTCGWTDGNAVEAGLNLVPPDDVDAALPGVGRVFNFNYNPPPGMPPPPDDITTVNSRSGAVTHLFYTTNRYHDLMYQIGFTEAARNFQHNNFGRGGFDFDRVQAQAQDFQGTNNANFTTPSDGGRGRMRMYTWTQTPARDGSLDTEIVVHELTHGTSNRLHGNAGGLGTNRSRGMGEGWSDFYALSSMSEATDPANGIYSMASYATYVVFGTNNAYYGIRRFPYALYSSTGGPNNRPFNPLTAADVNADCAVADGAFPGGNPTGNGCTAVHNMGEVWSSLLFEVRGRFIARLGFDPGNKRQLQFVTDGMKLAPLNPNMVQERDAIISAALASSVGPEAAADAEDVREGFRLRGLGFAATDNSTTVAESFIRPNATYVLPFSVSDVPGDNDGFPEPGENLLLNISVRNPTAAPVTNVMVSVLGGGTVNYGTIAAGATVQQPVTYTVPTGSPCGSLESVTINITSDTGSQIPFTQTFRLGVPEAALTFSNTEAITIPNGAPATTNGIASLYPSQIAVSGVTGNRTIKVQLNGLSHTTPADIDMLLVGPSTTQKMEIMSDQGGPNGVSNVNLGLLDSALTQLPTVLVSGEYRPTADVGQDSFPAPAPPPIYQLPAPGGTATLGSVFGTNGTNMNGNWRLFIVDDAAGNVGAMNGGWSITF